MELPNSRGENILLFLVQTVGRQIHEQRQYQRSRAKKNAAAVAAAARSSKTADANEPDVRTTVIKNLCRS